MQKEKMTLSEFIDENHNLLSTLAVLSGLTAFFSTLPIPFVATSSSFLLILAMIMTFRELKDKTPSLRNFSFKSLRLFIFSYSIILTGYIVVIYSLLKYREVSQFGLFVPLTFTIYSFIIFVLKDPLETILSIPFLRKYFFMQNGEWSNLLRRLFKVSAVGISIFSLYLGAGLSQPFNYILDQLSKIFIQVIK